MKKLIDYEEKAVEFLKIKGYKIVCRNFRTRFGEIDIIAKDKKYIVFIEVKARSCNYLVSPKEALDLRKQNKIKRAALQFTKSKPNQYFRFDFVGIIDYGGYKTYELTKGAFE